jgi:hypothetical protein
MQQLTTFVGNAQRKRLSKRRRPAIPVNNGRLARLDPSRTITLRRQFQRDLSVRFNKLRQAIVQLILHDDALGLRKRTVFNYDPDQARDDQGQWTSGEMSSGDVGKILESQYHNQLSAKNNILGYNPESHEPIYSVGKERFESPFLQDKWVRSESFHLHEIPIDSVAPTAEVHSLTETHSTGPIIVDINPGSYGRLHGMFGAPPRVIILDGKHRYAAAKSRGDKTIKAYVGDKAIVHINPIITHALGRWQFHSTEQKLVAFREWIKRQAALHLIGEHLEENAWYNRYIMDGFRRGAGRAFDDTRPQVREWQDSPEARQRLDFYDGTREEFLRSSFNWPTSREKVRLLASRTFIDLKGVTDGMAVRISHSLVDGLTKGDNPRVIARELVKAVNVSKARAMTIARTEIVRTHAEGQLQAFVSLGVTEVGVMAEWHTSGLGITKLGNPSPCRLCQPMSGVVMTVAEATGLIPRHPNCLCAWLPANVGEDEAKQKRTKGVIEGAIDESYSKEDPDKSSWGGADKTISKARPKGVFNQKG